MPSLREYVLTLKKYNPKAEDRLLKIYLLKAGWPIADIETTFAELNTVQMSSPVQTTPQPQIPTSIPTQIQTPTSTSTPTPVPATAPTTAPTITTIEIASPEIEIEPIHAPDTSYTPPPVTQPIINPIIPPVVTSIPSSIPTPEPISTLVPTPKITVQVPVQQNTPQYYPSSTIIIPDSPSTVTPQPQPQSQVQVQPQSQPNPQSSAQPQPQPQPQPPAQSQPQPPQKAPIIEPSGIVVPKPGFGLDSLRSSGELHMSYSTLMTDDLMSEKIDTDSEAESIKYDLDGNPLPVNPISFAHPIITPKITPPPVPTPPPPPQTPPPPAPPAQPLPNPPAPRFSTPPISTPPLSRSIPSTVPRARPIQPVSPTASASMISSVSQPVTRIPKRSVGKIIVAWVFILIFLGAIGFAYSRFVHGVYLFVAPPVDRDAVLAYIAESASQIDTAEYTVNLTLKTSPKGPALKSLSLATIDFVYDSFGSSTDEDFLAGFPSDTSMNLDIKGIYQKNKDSKDGEWYFKGDYMGEGVSATVDVASVKKNDITYINTNAFPEMLFDVKLIKDKWISISPSDTVTPGTVFPWYNLFSNNKSTYTDIPNKDRQKPKPANLDNQIARLISIASEEKVLKVIGDPEKIIHSEQEWYIPKKVTYEYNLELDLENFLTFIERSNVILQNEFGSSSIISLSEEQKNNIRSADFADSFNYFVRNGYFKMTIDKDKKFVGANIGIKLVSNEKQAELDMAISFDNINKSVSVGAPDANMSITDAYLLISGQSREMLDLKNQVKAVESIRMAITQYKNAHDGEAPDTLEALVQSIPLSNPGIDISKYSYKKVSKSSYLLGYQIILPPVPKKFHELALALVGLDTAGAVSARNDRSLQYLRFVNGTNTATEKTLSLESDADKKLDSDKDLVTNSLEQYIGMNITKKDTDGDGVSDYDELQKGGNPLGAGSWGEEDREPN